MAKDFLERLDPESREMLRNPRVKQRVAVPEKQTQSGSPMPQPERRAAEHVEMPKPRMPENIDRPHVAMPQRADQPKPSMPSFMMRESHEGHGLEASKKDDSTELLKEIRDLLKEMRDKKESGEPERFQPMQTQPMLGGKREFASMLPRRNSR